MAGAARTGGIIAGAGMASTFVSSIAGIAAGGSVLGPAFFLGLLTALPVAGFVLGIGLGDHGGGPIMAAALAAVAYALANRTPNRGRPRGRLRRGGYMTAVCQTHERQSRRSAAPPPSSPTADCAS